MFKKALFVALTVLLFAAACASPEPATTTTDPEPATAETTTADTEPPVSAFPPLDAHDESPITDTRAEPSETPAGGETQPAVPPVTEPSPTPAEGGLRVSGACAELLGFYIDNALEAVGPYGLNGGPVWLDEPVLRAAGEDWPETAMSSEPETAAAADFGGAAGTVAFSGTNVQVRGVDEHDWVKTDGRYLYVLMSDHHSRDGHELRIADVGDDGLVFVATLEVGYQPEGMLLAGDDLLTIGVEWRSSPVTRLTHIDVTDRHDPRVVADMSIDGLFRGARLTGSTVRVVTVSSPLGFDWAHPEGSGLAAEREATDRNKDLVEASGLDNWLPSYEISYPTGGTEWGPLHECADVYTPDVFTSFETVSIMMIDLGQGLSSPPTGGLWTSTVVAGGGATVYASLDSVYVADSPRFDPDTGNEHVTTVHKFDTSNAAGPVYVASGTVGGFLLNQFAMDEHGGDLRVAATTVPDWWWDETSESESHVTVLRPNGPVLERVGTVGGLGRGERIFSVRFMGPIAYVVTFRQTDPLYAIDLSIPDDPALLGELKIPGFSSYLHPLGDGWLLGVGQDASPEGRVWGLQVSLFDVTDPTDPRRVAQMAPFDAESSWSPVQEDHRAFQSLDPWVFIPYVAEWWSDARYWFDGGVAVVGVTTDPPVLNLETVLRSTGTPGPLSMDGMSWEQQNSAVPWRTVIAGDRVFSVTSGGIASHRLGEWDFIEFVHYPHKMVGSVRSDHGHAG